MRLKFCSKRIVLTLLAIAAAWSQPRRKVIVNEDCSGPGGSNLQTLPTMIQSPQVEVLGITVVSGDQWRDEEVAHTLRLLEIIGRTDIPVFSGAEFPLVRTRAEAQLWQDRYGKVAYAGAWDARWWHAPSVVPTLPEDQPSKPAAEDAVHFLLEDLPDPGWSRVAGAAQRAESMRSVTSRAGGFRAAGPERVAWCATTSSIVQLRVLPREAKLTPASHTPDDLDTHTSGK